MIKSMTGYGRSFGKTPMGEATVEIKSVNHRYFDHRVRLPRNLGALEVHLVSSLKEKLSRGRIEVNVTIIPQSSEQISLRINKQLALCYQQMFDQLADTLNISGEIPLEFYLQQPEVLITENGQTDVDEVWGHLLPVVSSALDALEQMRICEGEALQLDMLNHVRELEELVKQLRAQQPVVIEEFRQRFRDRIKVLLEGSELDPGRFEQEVALMADRSDVSEELLRLESHLAQLSETLAPEQIEPVGRKIDFLLQEIFREINTIGSKANNLVVKQPVLTMKALVEKIREQIQNVE